MSTITSDGTLPTPTVVAPPVALMPGSLYNIDGGTVRGTNLFHSFGLFSVGTGDVALFNGLPAIQNIVSRVTGGIGSQIDGAIASSITGANLFLMNPAGIMFGPNAQLNIDGSFHATTAGYIRFGDDIFHSDPTKGTAFTASNFTVSPPSAFGFLDSSPAAIDINTWNPPFLVGAPGQTLSFVGGPVNVGAADFSNPAYVMAPAGRLNLVSVASPGEAKFDGTGFTIDSTAQGGEIRIQGGSFVDAKEVFVRGGRLAIDEGVILPGAFSIFGLGPPPDGGKVDIDVSGAVTITGTAPEPFTNAPPGILVFNGMIDPNFGPVFDPSASPKVPDITIKAGSVLLSGFASVQTDRFAPGGAPNVLVKADSVTVENGAGIALFNFFEGPGGHLTVDAKQVTLSGGGVEGGAVGVTGLLAQGLFHSLYTGGFSIDPALTRSDSGTITVNATEKLTMNGGAQITTDSRTFGRSDEIKINAGDMSLADRGGVISAQSAFAGDSGHVKITATGQITIDNGFVVSANTFGSGESGNVEISADKGITISGTASGISSQTGSPPQAVLDGFATVIFLAPATFANLVGVLGLPATANILDVLGALADPANPFGVPLVPVLKVTPGNGGTITVIAPSITVSGQNSAIDSGTAWNGNAGNVHVNAGSVAVTGGGEIRSRSGILNLETGILEVGSGNAGTVSITATGPNTITVSGLNSAISTTTFGEGDGGNVVLNSAGKVQILSGGSVTADSLGGTGRTGDISITAGTDIFMDNGTISTRAVTSDGGNIKLTAPNIIRLEGSRITTSVESGKGGGGNINIDPQFIILNNSQIIANAFGGPGGNITLVANNFLPSATSIVQASSALSTPGTIVIASPENNVAGSIAQLAKSFLDASALLRGLCSARRTGAPSSFTVAGRGGVPVEADGYLPSFSTDAGTQVASADDGAAQSQVAHRGGLGLTLALAMASSLGCTP